MHKDQERKIEFISAINRGVIGGQTFVLIGLLVVTVILIFILPESAYSILVPLTLILDLILLIRLVRLLVVLPLSVILKGEVLTIEWITHNKSFDRKEIINFEVHTKETYSRNIRRWNHKLVLNTLDKKTIQLSSLSSGKQEPGLLRLPLNELEKWIEPANQSLKRTPEEGRKLI
jgi:hypothetical protein